MSGFAGAGPSSYPLTEADIANAGDTRYVKTAGGQALTSAQQSAVRATLGLQKRNYIINGAMMVSQENGAAAGTTNGYYPVDQWLMDLSLSGGAVSLAQVASRTPQGSPNRIRATVTAAQASLVGGQYCILRQPIEGTRMVDLLGGTSSAKIIVAQFGVKGPAGTYQVGFPSGDFGTTVNGSFTIAAGEANTDVYKTVTLQVPTSGNYLTTNAVGAHFQIVLAQPGQFNLFGTNGNVFELFDVGLYEGSTAPAFQVPDYAYELQLCKRYFSQQSVILRAETATQHVQWMQWVTQMRATPTLTLSGLSYSNGNSGGVAGNVNQSGGELYFTATAAGGFMVGTLTVSARM